MVICLERGADLHMVQLMPLPLTVSCFRKIQIGFTFLVPAHPGSPGKRAVKRVCVCLLPLQLILKTGRFSPLISGMTGHPDKNPVYIDVPATRSGCVYKPVCESLGSQSHCTPCSRHIKSLQWLTSAACSVVAVNALHA